MYHWHTLPRPGYRHRRTALVLKILARSPGGKGDQPTRQRICAIILRFIVVATVHNIQSPNVRARNSVHPLNVECCVGPAKQRFGTVDPVAAWRTLVRCRRVSSSVSTPSPLLYSHERLGPTQDYSHPETLYHHPSFPLFRIRLRSHGHVLGPADKPPCLGRLYRIWAFI